ncbi:MAG: DNA mismatch repair endonuclease MutL, partial [Anaerolineales bacterium]
MAIHILPSEIASQIAAGEVVERPASVVKELIENALDAQANRISINVTGAGRDLIEVSDDGMGMDENDLQLAVLRYATSKIETAADLSSIRTLGFRGEALASISSVSRFQITSRTKSMNQAIRLQLEGGVQVGLNPIGAPEGTSVRVENLFYNVPARLKFLKHDQTERNRIEQVVAHYAIAYPQVQFLLIQEGKRQLTSSGNGNRMEVLIELLGIDIAKQMIEVIYEEKDIRVLGFISPPHITRSNRAEIHFYINQRPIQDSTLASAVIQAYQHYLMVGRYPIVKIFIEIDPSFVDVNVHPTKAEVRFANPNWIFSQLQHAVRRALTAASPIPQIATVPTWQPNWKIANREQESQAINLPQPMLEQPNRFDNQARSPIERIPLLRLIGQIAATYLVAEGPDGLYLIDQHAAHERVLFEKFLKSQSQKAISQNLLTAAIVTLPLAQARMVEAQLEILNQIGFVIESFGPTSYKITAIPSILAGMQPQDAIMAVIEDFEEDEAPLEKEKTKKIIARICKRVAVKAGQTLSPEEQRMLLTNLEACESPRTCPHGRPTM